MTKTLLPHEWLAVSVLILGITSFAFLAYHSHSSDLSDMFQAPQHLVPQEIIVSIQGAVVTSGLYTVQKGATVEEALALAQPTSEANLSKLKLNKKVRNGQKIKVPAKSKKLNK